MKLIVVECPKNKKVQVEDRGTGGAICPQNCPMKKKSMCNNRTFRYTKPMNPSVTPDILYEAEKTNSIMSDNGIGDSAIVKTQSHESTGNNSRSSNDNSTIKCAAVEENIAAKQSDSTASQPPRQKQDRTDKYNAWLRETNIDSIFSVVQNRGSGQPCFVDGAYVFYERAPGDVRCDGNAKDAMFYIFKHWYVSRVFTEDGNSYCEDFLYLLSLCGFTESEEKLCNIANNMRLSKNQKFFRLFYTVIYERMINGFYWNDGDSLHREITPIFSDVNDFYSKFSEAYDPSEFIASYRECFDELVLFLCSFANIGNPFTWFRETIPQVISEKFERLTYVSEEDGKIAIINFGSCCDFVSKMSTLQSPDIMKDMCGFLEMFEITPQYKILPRRIKLAKWNGKNTEDDCVYKIIGLTEYTDTTCATAYNNYTTILREYIRVFKPRRLTIGNLSFSKEHFIMEISAIVEKAGSYLTTSKPKEYDDVKAFYTVKSLFEREVFERYEAMCETSQLAELKKIFAAQSMSISDYFACSKINHSLFYGGRHISVSEYIGEIVSQDANFIRGRLTKDKALKAFLAAKVDEQKQEFVDAKDTIDKMLKKQKELIGKLKKPD